ncbi:3-oxoacyl-[acyl-carrier-protein] synthase III C-terminal domain-containing protein [Micromonospora sp. NPDC023956]|uniref:3-oxoacyl-[acyl-carrier-protein] synthase III C-terminal domain-containing protein n=1 Tax=Micromonospora sp. NPDC023956 TaxID=3155722 RepID=UPI0033C19F01
MRWTDIYVAGGASALGRREETATAVAEGRYDAAVRDADGFLAVSVADDDGPATDLAVRAARRALTRAAVPPERIRLLVHAGIGPQGPAHVAPASRVHGAAVGGVASAVEVRQSSNGGMTGIELAAAYLAAAPAGTAAMVTTADRFTRVDRYRADAGNVLGDGGTALVLTRGTGVARLLSTVVLGDGRFADIGLADSSVFPDRPAFFAEHGHRLLDLVAAMSQRQRESVRQALAEAGVAGPAGISRWAFDNVGLTMVDRDFRTELGIDDSVTCWEWGRTVGHLGAGDPAAGLVHLLETGAVGPGDRVALCGMGSGFTYSCAVVEVVDAPAWDVTDRSEGGERV